MFLAVFAAGLWADSSALLADSADNLGDALVYVISLYVAYRSLRWRAGAAFMKGLVQLAFGLGINIGVVIKMLGQPNRLGSRSWPSLRDPGRQSSLSGVAAAPSWRRREQRSVWLCSSNDVTGNLAVIVSGAAVWLTGNFWPHLIVAALLATVFLHTSYEYCGTQCIPGAQAPTDARQPGALDNMRYGDIIANARQPGAAVFRT